MDAPTIDDVAPDFHPHHRHRTHTLTLALMDGCTGTITPGFHPLPAPPLRSNQHRRDDVVLSRNPALCHLSASEGVSRYGLWIDAFGW